MKKMIAVLFVLLLAYVTTLNILKKIEMPIDSVPTVIKSNYYITLSQAGNNSFGTLNQSQKLDIILYDKKMSKFAFLENYEDISFNGISAGMPDQVNSRTVVQLIIKVKQ